jgi:hypothetical protein
MLAYVFWHRPAADVPVERYEQALLAFHRSLAHRPPSGLCGSAALRAPELPWLAAAEGASVEDGGYEDWYLLESWSAVGVLESAAVSRGHATAHAQAARRAGAGAGAVYRLLEGDGRAPQARLAVWVTRPPGQSDPTMADLLEDGIDPAGSALWRRCLVLGPAPEFCLLSSAPALGAETGLSAARLPAGWSAQSMARAPLGDA